MENEIKRIKNVKDIMSLIQLLQDDYEGRHQQLNGNGILDLDGIQHALLEDEKEFEKVKDIITNNMKTFVILYAYGSPDLFVFSSDPKSTDHEVYENFQGHGTAVILENLPKKIFIYGEDD